MALRPAGVRGNWFDKLIVSVGLVFGEGLVMIALFLRAGRQEHFLKTGTVCISVILLLACNLATAEEVQKAQKALKTPVTFSCTDKPIGEVLMSLAEQVGVDIVKSPQVQGNVTVKLTAVPLGEALSNILAAYNYTYTATNNMISVVPLPEVALLEEKLVTHVYKIAYADTNEVARTLGNFLSQKGRVAVNRQSGHIMVTDTQDRISGIDKFIEQIDQVMSQVLVEVRIYDCVTNEGFELSPDWYLGRNTPLETTTEIESAAPKTLKRTTTTTGSGKSPASGDDAIVTVNDDQTVATLLPDYFTYSKDDTEIRTDEILDPYGYSKTTSTIKKRKPFVAGSFNRETGGTLNFSILDNAIDLEFVLGVLHSQAESKLLADPRVLVVDNETANFEIIREIPYRELRQVAREDPITYTAFKNVGVTLKVTPHVGRDGMIKMRIAPEFGVVVGENAFGAPMVDTRRADTMALIEDGQTIVLGGLRQKTTSRDMSKVPVLGDMPLIGGLFKSQTEAVKTSELLIFITARIVGKAELTGAEKARLDASQIEPPILTDLKLEQKGPSVFRPASAAEKEKGEISNILQRVLEEKK